MDHDYVLAEKKLSLLYLADGFSMPLTNTQITEFYLRTKTSEFFDLQQYLNELTESKLLSCLDINGRTYYSISPEGKEALTYFRDTISEELRGGIDAFIDEQRDNYRNDSQLQTNSYANGPHSQIVELKLMEGQESLLEIKLNVVSARQAKLLADAWRSKGAELYKTLIDTLIGEGEE